MKSKCHTDLILPRKIYAVLLGFIFFICMLVLFEKHGSFSYGKAWLLKKLRQQSLIRAAIFFRSPSSVRVFSCCLVLNALKTIK